MKLGIMQPYFFPYLGYFSLIKHTDAFILFDTPQFMRHGWIERNRTLKPDAGWQYIQVPLVKHSMHTAIKDTAINNALPWRQKITAQLQHYKKKAPFFKQTMAVIGESLALDTNNVVELNKMTLSKVCAYLGLPFSGTVFSQMNLKITAPEAPDEWALNICKALGNVDEYVNPIGGLDFFDRSKYEREGIKISFQKMNLPSYTQHSPSGSFESGLSIIDVMMFNSPEEIQKMLDCFSLV